MGNIDSITYLIITINMKRNYLFLFFAFCTLSTTYSQCNSVMPDSITSATDTICAAGVISVTIHNGTLDGVSQWELRDGSCSGTVVATSSGSTFTNVPVSSTTTFYCISSDCTPGDVGSCVSLNIVLADLSTDPSSLSISQDTLCAAGNVDITVSGGALGTIAQWELFEASCGSAVIATSSNGTFSSVAANSSNTYYARANGYCNTTNCVDIDFFLADSSFPATNITSTDTIICQNENITLSLNGGVLGTNAQWAWYDDNCGGNQIGTGSSINLNPLSTTTYYARAIGECNNTVCEEINITTIPHYIELDSLSIDSVFNPSDTTWFIPDSVCPQSEVQLFAHFTGPFPNGYSITWYQNSCGSTPIGVGDSIKVYPDSTTTYYARVIGTCGESACKSISIATKDGSLAPNSITTTANNFCTGGSATLNIIGGQLGTGAQWAWYKGNCGGSIIGTGTSLSVTPASTTMYYARANGGGCGSTSCKNILINTYDLNMYHSPLSPTCETSVIILDGGFPVGGTYSGPGVTDSLFDPSIAGIGSHTITYSYSDGNSCSDSIHTTIDVLQQNPDPINILASSYEICNGNSSVLSIDTNNVLINGSEWIWYEGACATGVIIDTTENLDTLWVSQIDTTYSSVNNITVSPSTTTNYYVRAEGGQCPPSNCIGLTIDVYTLETHVSKFDAICGVATPAFELTGGDPSGGVFSGNGVNNGMFYPEIAGVGDHSITYTYTLGPCVATDSENLNIQESDVVVYSSIERETCAEGGIMIHAHATGGLGYYGYEWSNYTSENPLTYADSGYYNVLVSDARGCYTRLDNIHVDADLSCIELVNTFTPNNDGINDTWVADFSSYENVELLIFNKWGNQIAQLNTPTISWNGMYEGNALPAGTYYYVIKLTESSGEVITQTGPITLLR